MYEALFALLALPLACATRVAPPKVEADEMDELSEQLAGEGLDAMRSYVAHLRAISDPLRIHATELCEDEIVPYLGVILETIRTGVSTPLDRARRLRGIDASPTVVSVVADSPAARAGLRPDGVIRSPNGRRIHSDLVSYMETDSDEPLRLGIQRAGGRREVVLSYESACMPLPIFSPYGALSTTRYFSQVVVPRGLMDFVRSDDELAILVAREMAHQLLDDEFARVTRYVEERKNPENLVYHGYVAARTLLMPRIIAELESMYSSATAESGYSRRSPTRARR